jgi:hypothetical protein
MYMSNNYKNIFVGENKYTTGMIFIFATLAGFFTHLRKLGIENTQAFLILSVVAMSAFAFSKI